MRIYLAGKMTGLPEYNYPQFAEVSADLRSKGHMVINPADVSMIVEGRQWADYLKRSLIVFLGHDIEAVALLPNWTDSAGAKIEVLIALGLKLQILDAFTLEKINRIDLIRVLTKFIVKLGSEIV